MRILILGLDGAGKTTILYRLQVGEVVTTIPSKLVAIWWNVSENFSENFSHTFLMYFCYELPLIVRSFLVQQSVSMWSKWLIRIWSFKVNFLLQKSGSRLSNLISETKTLFFPLPRLSIRHFHSSFLFVIPTRRLHSSSPFVAQFG